MKEGKRVRIEASEVPEGVTIFLEDKLLERIHKLDELYVFTSTDSDSHTRFKLHLGDEFLSKGQFSASDDYIVYQDEDELIFVQNTDLIDGEATLFNTAGQVMMNDVVKEDMRIPFTSYATGVYMLRVVKDGQVYAQKVIIP